jgi:hypothetical protein
MTEVTERPQKRIERDFVAAIGQLVGEAGDTERVQAVILIHATTLRARDGLEPRRPGDVRVHIRAARRTGSLMQPESARVTSGDRRCFPPRIPAALVP